MNPILRLLAPLAILASVAAQIPDCAETKTTSSGLQWCQIAPGRDEAKPRATDMVTVHYTGWLTNGTKFDSSRDREEPSSFQLNGVIKGWTEGLQLMSPGARFKFTIPPELGYGDQDNGVIPPGSTLVFDVELISVTRLPEFVPANKEKQKDLPSKAKWELLSGGQGTKAEANEAVAFRYALFDEEGKLLQCSEQQKNHLIAGTRETLPFAFFKELCDVMQQGDVVRVEVPGDAIPSLRGKKSVWLVELKGIHRLPTFRALDPAKTVTTQTGLKYEVIAPGTGESPKATDKVSALYTGWLTDGTMFDSAHARGAPTDFGLGQVIRGWTEGLQLMKPGGKFLFEIPSELAYGPAGSGPKIGPNATLIFLVELVAVK